MFKRAPVLLACGAWLIATAAYAQAAPAAAPAGATVITPVQSIVAAPKVYVPSTGPEPSTVSPLTIQAAPGPIAAQKESRDFIQTYATPTASIDQIARWHRPICVSVAGLGPDQEARVAARIQEVAQGVGMRAMPPGCKPNIEVVFTDQPQAFMDKVAKNREEVLGYYHRHDRDKLKTVTRPVQAWYVTTTSTGATDTASVAFVGLTTNVGAANGIGGGPDGAMIGTTAMNYQGKSEVADDPDNPGPIGCAEAPQFTHCLTSELSNALIVVDTTRLKKGQTLGPVNDYLSMLALAQVRSLDGCTSLSSVIDLMGQSCPGRDTPNGLTPADAAYLTALYTADLEKNRPLEVDDIANRMSAMLSRRSSR